MSTHELDLRTLPAKSKFELQTQSERDNGSFTYDFEIIEAGEHPVCVISERNAQGQVTASSVGILEGTGIWTTPKQNPTQKGDPLWGKPHQELALSIGHGRVSIGGFICIIDPNNRQRFMIEFPLTRIVAPNNQTSAT